MSLPPLNTGGRRFTIANALLNQFANVAPWNTSSLKFVMWDNLDASLKPAIFVVCTSEERVQGGEHVPPLLTLKFEVFIYTFTEPTSDVLPMQVMSDILDAVDQALAPSPLAAFKQTLGNLVSHCWIEGTTRVVSGDLDGQGLAIIPVNVLIPS